MVDGTIVFFEADLLRVTQPHEEALILMLNIDRPREFCGPPTYIYLQTDELFNECVGKSREVADGF